MPACRGQALPQEDLLRTGAILKGIAMGARYPADSLNSEDVSGLSQVELQAAREEQQVRVVAGHGTCIAQWCASYSHLLLALACITCP